MTRRREIAHKFVAVVTLNPALGKNLVVRNFVGKMGTFYTAPKTDLWVDGKGVITARVLKLLGESPIVCGFMGGVIGDYIVDELDKKGIKHDFVRIAGTTRQVYSILDSSSRAEPPIIQINEKGPKVSDSEIYTLIEKYNALLDISDIVILVGSLPINTPDNIYEKMIKMANEKSVKVLFDTSDKVAMTKGQRAKPFMVKQNLDRAQKLLNIDIRGKEDSVKVIHSLGDKGTKWAMLTMGPQGAIIREQNHFWRGIPPVVKVRNTIGCGDSFLAGITKGMLDDLDVVDIIKLGVACGTANTLTTIPGELRKKDITSIKARVKIELLT